MGTVSERAFIQRINRKLRPREERLVKARGAYWHTYCGKFYRLNWRYNSVVDTHVDLVELARDLGALASSETLQEEPAPDGKTLVIA